MTPEILLVPSSVTLVPGATGRSDVAQDERDALVGDLARALAAAGRRAARSGLSPSGGVRVVVVAPAPVSRSRTTDAGRPDLGAMGIVAPEHPVPGPGGLEPAGVPLHVAASVVTVLLRLAGWRGPIRTVEVGAEGAGETDGEAAGIGALLDRTERDLEGGAVSVLVFTTGSARAHPTPDRGGPSHAAPTGSDASPSALASNGVPELLRRAELAVAALHRDVVARSTGS